MSNLSLIPVTSKNRRAIEKLKVFPHQTGFIESVADCMKEADQLAAWHPMCIYDNDTLIGFTMYGMIQEPAYTRLWFDRLLIDKQHQGKGYAKPAADPHRSGQRGNRFCGWSSVPGSPVFPYTCPGAWRRFWHQQHPARRAVPVSLVYGVVDPADRFHCGRNSFFKFSDKIPTKRNPRRI
ncbi:GNAT family N-acetyltransferase [Pseudoflavonifractor gallinarum]|uniref:GNAT family N-acetyltransferase n=1 Tax=Pseudoflavonifractor gallinarum TaxID=2779352 RepID=UPI0036F38066